MTQLEITDPSLYLKIIDAVTIMVADSINIAIDSIDIDRNLSEYSLDSISISKIINRINNKYKLKLSPTIIYGHKTIKEFTDFLINKYSVKMMDNKTLESFYENDNKILILISAKNIESLTVYITHMIDYLEKIDLDNIFMKKLADELMFEREAMDQRLAVVVENGKELIEILKSYLLNPRESEKLCMGQAKRDNVVFDIFSSNPVGKELLSQWLAAGKFRNLMKLWTAGINLDWRGIYKANALSAPIPEKEEFDRIFLTNEYQDLIPSMLEKLEPEFSIKIDEEEAILNAFVDLEKLSTNICYHLYEKLNADLQAGNIGNARVAQNAREIIQGSCIAPKFERLLEAFIFILKGGGKIKTDGNGMIYLEKNYDIVKQVSDFEIDRNEYLSKYAIFSPHIHLLWQCFQNAVDILKGKISAVEVFFPKMSMELVEPVYKNNPLADYYNTITGVYIETYVKSRLPYLKDEEHVTILEIGAGTGGTSSTLFKYLKTFEDRVRYIYTDVSEGFIRFGQKNYNNKLPQIIFKALDIETDPKMQGFDNGFVDVIVGANVVHATKYIKNTILNIKKLLKTNGLLLLNEVVRFQIYSTLTFGLLDGWWLYGDDEHRIPHSPLLSYGQWEHLLKRAGFSQVTSIHTRYKSSPLNFQDIIVAESDGRII